MLYVSVMANGHLGKTIMLGRTAIDDGVGNTSPRRGKRKRRGWIDRKRRAERDHRIASHRRSLRSLERPPHQGLARS